MMAGIAFRVFRARGRLRPAISPFYLLVAVAIGGGGNAADPATAPWEALGHPQEAARQQAATTLIEQRGPAALTLFMRAMTDADPLVRRGGIFGLSRMGPLAKSAAPALTKALGDPEAAVRLDAVQALLKLKEYVHPQIGVLTTALSDREVSMRMSVLQLLGDLQKEARGARPAIMVIIRRDADPSVRIEGLKALAGTCGLGEAQPVCMEVLKKDRAVAVRLAALELLTQFAEGAFGSTAGKRGGGRNVEGPMETVFLALTLSATRDPDPAIRLAAAKGLGHFGHWAGALRQAVGSILKDPESPVRVGGLQALADMREGRADHIGSWGVDRFFSVFLDAAEHADPRVRQVAMEALGRIGEKGGREALPVVFRALHKDPDPLVRLEAVKTLKEFKMPKVLAALQMALRDPDFGVQGAARTALDQLTEDLQAPPNVGGGIPALEPAFLRTIQSQLKSHDSMGWDRAAIWLREAGPTALPILVEALGDANPRVREVAADHLGFSGWPEAQAPLLKALEDASSDVRASAVWALRIFPNPRVRTALNARLHDPSKEVQDMAGVALEILDHPPSHARPPSRPSAPKGPSWDNGLTWKTDADRLVVEAVQPSSAAGGVFRPGDWVVRVGKIPVASPSMFHLAFWTAYDLQPDQPVWIQVIRPAEGSGIVSLTLAPMAGWCSSTGRPFTGTVANTFAADAEETRVAREYRDGGLVRLAYYAFGRLTKETRYLALSPVSTRYFDAGGHLAGSVTYHKGAPWDGMEVEYFSEGQKRREKEWKKGAMVQETVWNPDGRVLRQRRASQR